MADLGQNKNWRGMYPGNYSGNLWQTFNVDLERHPGRVVLSDKMRRFSAGLGVVSKFVRTNATATDQWFGIVDQTDIVRNGNSILNAGTWITDDTTGTFNDPRDMVVHEFANGEQRLLCTRATNIAILNKTGGANVWDDDWFTAVASGPTLTSLNYHPIARLQRLVGVGDKQSNVPVLHTIDKDDVVTNSKLSFPPEFTVKNIYTSTNRFWIGLMNDYSGNARVIEWDGFSDTYNNEYDLIGSIPLAGFIVNDIPYFITDRGYIMQYSGGGFKTVASFGLEEDRVNFTEFDISNYGCTVDGDTVYINVGAGGLQSFSATVMSTPIRRLRSGIWVFNTKNRNLYHNMGLGEHASAGTDVNYGCSPFFNTRGTGAVIKPSDGRQVFASASVYTGGATWVTGSQSGIYQQIPSNELNNNAGRNRGYLITPYVPIGEVDAMWESLWVKFKKFIDSGNRIVVKWRTRDPLYNSAAADQGGNELEMMTAPITWVNTTSFTSVLPTGISVGDEVEILSGDNAGCSFNISALSATPDNSTTITVTIDEAAPTSSTDTGVARFDNWVSETAISDTTIGSARVPFTGSTTSNHGEFIQLKIEMRGFDIQIDELIPSWKDKTNKRQT